MDAHELWAEEQVCQLVDAEIAKMEQAQRNQRLADMIEVMCQNNILTMGRYQQ